MDKTKKKKVQMPSGIRSKLTAAIAMLLISSLLVVGSTYAWFTLSTAPEVTGITTSVGANGNLEIALLDTTTYGDLSKITSAVGDSSEAADQPVTKANITWGNLVNLSDDSYGLKKINLLPTRLNFNPTDQTKIYAVANLLKTPVYGADGRVINVSGTTFTSGEYASEVWKFDSVNAKYGVRAIGANDNLTAQEAGLLAARVAYKASLNSAKSTIQTALSANGSELASAITTLAMSTEATITSNQQTAITNMITASGTALNHVDAAYKQVLLALAASVIPDATTYETLANTISSKTSYSEAKAVLPSEVSSAIPEELTSAVAALDAQKAVVDNDAEGSKGAKQLAASGDYKGALSKLVDTTKVKVNGYEVTDSGNGAADDLMGANDQINSTFMNQVIADGGAIVEMPDGSGVFAYVGSVAGNYSAGCKVSIDYKGLKLTNMNATMKTTANPKTEVNTLIGGLRAADSTGGTTALSDTYGYALDFAFRTNASGSKLQLQTAAAQRVYTDSTSTATQGAGSSMTFKAVIGEDGKAVLTDAQVQKLMGAIRVAFINPESGDIYAIAALDNITGGDDGMKGELVLKNYTVSDKGVMTITNRPSTSEEEQKAKDDIMELPQNTATKLTAVVWLDGDYVDNGDVANAAQSITGSMNLQFSSSADLTPMQNTALKNKK